MEKKNEELAKEYLQKSKFIENKIFTVLNYIDYTIFYETKDLNKKNYTKRIYEKIMNNETKFLIDSLTKNLVLRVIKEFKLSIKESLDAVYNSQLYDKILDLETGLYFQSAGYNYQLLRKELLEGKFA